MRCVYCTVLSSFLFIAVLELVYVAYSVSLETSAFKHAIENLSWSRNAHSTFFDLKSLMDIDRYYRNVLIPVTLSNTTILDNNYLIALRINLKRAQWRANTLDRYKEEFPRVWAQADYKYDQNNAGEDTSQMGVWNYTREESFMQAGAYCLTVYPQLIAGPSRLSIALYEWRLMHRLWLNSRTVSLVCEMLVQNSNLQLTTYYYQVIEITGAGRVRTHSHIYGVFIEPFEYVSSFSSGVLFLCILLLLEVLARIYGAVLVVLRCATVAIRERRNDLEYYEGIGLVTLVLELVGISLYANIFASNIGTLQLPVAESDPMQDLLSQTVNFRTFVQVCSVCILLLTVRAILILKNEFPSFGILFDTIIHAREDLIYFSFISFIILFSFGLAGYQLFGLKDSNFSSVAGSILTLCTMALGLTDLAALERTKSPLYGLFFLIFMLIFRFVVMKMFLGIVMSTYTVLRRRNQMFIMAKASILAREAENMKTRWVNFLLCRRPQSTAIELAKKYVALREQQSGDASDKEKQLIDLRNTMLQAQTISLKDTLKYNMSQLEVFQSVITVQTTSLKTREQYIEELMQEIKTINDQKRKRHEEESRLKRDKTYIYSTVKDMLIYSIFMIIFSIMVVYRARVEDKFLLEESLRSDLQLTPFEYRGNMMQFEDVTTPQIMKTWLEEVYFPLTISNWNLHRRPVSELVVRETYIRIAPKRNRCDGTASVFPLVRETEQYGQLPLREYSTPSAHESFVGVSGHRYEFKAGEESYRSFGGHVAYWTKDKDVAWAELQRIQTDDLLSNLTKALIYDYVVYSGDMQLLAIASVGFLRTEAGGIKNQVSCIAFELDLYSLSPTTVPALEVIFVLFLLYYFYRFCVDWLACLREQKAMWLSERKEKLLLANVLDEIKGIEQLQRTGSEECINIVRKLLDYIYSVFSLFLRTSVHYLKKDFYSIFDVIFLSLSIALMATVLKLQVDEFRNDFDVQQLAPEKLLPGMWRLAELDLQYRSLAAVDCLVIYIRMLKNFRFSSQLSVLTDVLGSASLDIIFFAAMFTMLLGSYALMAYTLLGHKANDFSELSQAFLSTYFLLLGDFRVYQILGADNPVGGIFLITFFLFFHLFLINMFIAIIVAHFYQVTEEIRVHGEEEGVYSMLKGALLRYLNKLGAGRLKRLLSRCFGSTENEEGEASAEEALPGLKPEPADAVEPESVQLTAFNANRWIHALESRILESSRGSLNFVSFKSTLGVSELKNNFLTAPLDAAAITFMTKELWLQERTIARKTYIWRQLSLAHQAAQDRNQGLRALGQAAPSLEPLSSLQTDIWLACSIQLKLLLWTDSFGFNASERANLWNISLFSAEQLAQDPKDWSLPRQLEVIKAMVTLNSQVDEETGILLLPPELTAFLASWQAANLRFHRVYSKLSEDSLTCIAEYFEETKDERLALWLSQQDTERMELFLSNLSQPEAILLFFLQAEEVRHHIIRLEILDATAGALMDSRLFDKHVRLAQLQAEKTRLKELEDELATTEADSKALESYKYFLQKKQLSKSKQLDDKYKQLAELTNAELRSFEG